MTVLSATLRLRPTRIGFLVNPTDMPSVRQIMQVCTCMWGGVYNPIIPVCASTPEPWKSPPFLDPTCTALANGYIDFFEPDIYVEAEPGLSANLNIKDTELAHGCGRISPLIMLLETAARRGSNPPVGLGIIGVYKALYEREFKFVARHDHRVAQFKDGAPEDEPFLDAVCGGFPRTGMLEPLEHAYRDSFAPQMLKANAKNWIKALQEGLSFPLHFTAHEIERAPDGGFGEPILFVADPASPLDMIDLWNIRLFRRHVIPINLRWFATLAPFIGDFIKRNHRPLPGNPHGVMMHTVVEFGRSIGDKRAQALVDEVRFKDLPPGSWQLKPWYDRIWTASRDDHVWRPGPARVTAKSQDLNLTVSDDGRERSVQFSTLSPDFASTYHNSPSGWINVLRFRGNRSGATLALNLHNDFEPERIQHLRIGGAVIPSREGLVLPQEFKGHGEYLRVLTGREAMTDWLKQHGVAAEISSSGRVTEQVMDSLDGYWGVKLLAHQETLQLLDRMAKSVKKFRDGTIEEYQDRTAAATAWGALIARRSKETWSSNITLDRFVEANILKLGLAIRCVHCVNVNWYAIADLRETVICDRCRKSYPFPQGSIGLANTPWKFRVVGPFSVPDYADGAYATVLTLRVFSETLSSGHTSLTYSPGLNFTLDNRMPFEVDFSFWYRRDRCGGDEEETVMVFGEAKSFGTKCFHAKDVERMRQLADLFPGAFLVFAALKEALHEEERTAIAALAQWGREPLDDGRPRAPVIVLTGTELFSTWHIAHTWKELEGKRKQFAEAGYVGLDNLWTLADVTQQIYLNLPSRSEELQCKWEAEAIKITKKKNPAKKDDGSRRKAAKD